MSDPVVQKLFGLAAMLLVILGAWVLLSRAASRARRHFEELLAQTRHSLEADDPEFQSRLSSSQRRLTALRLLVNTARYLLMISAILMVLGQLNLELGSLLLPAGFLGAALGMGAQNLVRDLVAGFFLVFEEQFAVGDVVCINGILGTVEELGLRVTRVRDDSGQMHFFANGAISSVSRYPRRQVRLLLAVPAPDSSQRDAVVTVLLKAIRQFDGRYHVLAAPPQVEMQEKMERTSTLPDALYIEIMIRPARSAVVREKLPAHVATHLQQAGIKAEAGADVEIINAPAS